MERKPKILPCLYRSSQFNVTKVPCQKTQIVPEGAMVPRKSEEEVRGSYIGLRRHHHLPAADVRCQIYFLLHTFVYVSHAIVNILYVYPSVSYANDEYFFNVFM